MNIRVWLAVISAACSCGSGFSVAGAQTVFVSDAAQLSAAIETAHPGSRIIIAPGRYAVKMRFTSRNSGTQSAPVLVTSRDGPGTVIIDGASTGADIVVKFTTASHIRLEGLDITGGGYHGVFFGTGAHNITVNGNRIYDNFSKLPMDSHAELKGSGPAENRPHHIAITNNEIFHTRHPPGGNFQGIDCNFCDDFRISGNYLHDVREPTSEPFSHFDRGSCIQMKSASTNVVIERNRIARCHIGIVYGGEGLASPEHIGGMVRNNLIYDSTEIGIAAVNVTDGKIFQNTFWKNGVDILVARDSRNPLSQNSVEITENNINGPVRIFDKTDKLTMRGNRITK